MFKAFVWVSGEKATALAWHSCDPWHGPPPFAGPRALFGLLHTSGGQLC
jgi:hypothetical protein